MRTLKLRASVGDSHRIDIPSPADTPEDEQEIVVEISELAPANQERLRSFFMNLDKHPPPRSHIKEDVDAYLVKERASWT